MSQNFPELTSVVALPGELQIEGTLDVPASDVNHLALRLAVGQPVELDCPVCL